MKISAYATLSSLSAGDLLVAFDPEGRRTSSVDISALTTYALAPPVLAYFLTAGTNRLLQETSEPLLLESSNGDDDVLVQNLAALTAPDLTDLLVAVEASSGATKSIRLAEFAAYAIVVDAAPVNTNPHYLTEAGDTLITEASEPIQVE